MGVSFADYVRIINDLSVYSEDIRKAEACGDPAGLQLAAVMSDRHSVIMQVEWPNRCQSTDEDGVAETGNGDGATAGR